MPDGQDKSDDLIAELAKLMAAPTGAEPEGKPAPRLVAAADPQPAPRPAIRIPGMDAPVPVSAAPSSPPPSPAPATSGVAVPAQTPPRPAPAPESLTPGSEPTLRSAPAATERPAPAPAPVSSPASSPVARTLRIPGMDSPISVAPVAARQDQPPAAPEAAPRPGPTNAWQDREVPRSPLARPEGEAGPKSEPAIESIPDSRTAPRPTAAAAAARIEIPAPLSMPAPKSEPRPETRPEPEAMPEPQSAATPGSAAPETDAATARPAPRTPTGTRPQPPEPLSRPQVEPEPAPTGSSGDAIADLIAAELDAADFGRAIPAPTPTPTQPSRTADARPRAPVATPQRSVSPQSQAQARAAADADRFAVAPMFGPASRGGSGSPPPHQPPAPSVDTSVSAFDRERDPMEEIESLIGEAVRVELTGGDRSSSAPAPRIPAAPALQTQGAPVVPPLTTSFAPRRTSIKDSEPSIPPSEAAILAAAAAVSAEIGNGDSMIADEPASRPRARPERRMGGARQLVGMGVAAVLLVAAGVGLYLVLGMNRGNDAEAPVLTAEAEPVKEDPPATQSNADSQGTVVFSETGNDTAPEDEQLVSRDDSTETTIADIARTVGDGTDAADSDLGVRQVKTITVRPDGSIVSGDDSLSGTEALPVDKPNVAAIEGADVQPSELLAALAEPDGAAPAVSAETSAAPGASDPLAIIAPSEGGTIEPGLVAPVPMPRPRDRTVLVGGSNWQRTAAVDNSPVYLTGGGAAPAAASGGDAPVSDAGGAYAQLSSQRSVAEAQASLKATQRRLGGVLNGAGLEIRRVDLGGRGIWYRVVLPTGSFQDATQACAIIKSNGGDCLPVNG